jgi:hypothetical protein
MYLTDIDPNLANSLFPLKAKSGVSGRDKGNQPATPVDSFRVSIAQELTKVGIESQAGDIPDLSYVIIVNSFSSSMISAGSFGTNTYSLSGKARVAIVNGKKEIYMMKDIDISEQMQLDVNKLIKNNFTNELSNQGAIVNYTLLFQVIQQLATRAQGTYVNAFKTRTITLPSVYRARKKYPELVFFDSLNTALVAELNKKAVTDYKEFILPYEKEITTFINNEFPKGYDTKDIKVAGNYTLAFLYYLAYDTAKLRQTVDFLYENGTKVLGIRVEHSDRKALHTETMAYYKSLGEPKIRPDSTSGDVKQVFGGTEKSNDGWLVLEKGDTLKGKHIIKRYHGTMIDLDGSNKVIFEYTNEKGKTVRKTFKYGEVKTLCFNQRVFESHKFKPNMAQAGSLSMDLFKTREYMLEVIYSSDKIKLYKDTYGEDPTNAVLFARPGEAELANQGKEWNKNKPEMMKEYFKDCPTVVATLEKTGYDLKSDKGYMKLAEDYSTACK